MSRFESNFGKSPESSLELGQIVEGSTLGGRKYDPSFFCETLERGGLEVLETTQVVNDSKVRVKVPAGMYKIGAGFEEINLSETKKDYGNRPPELRNTPIILDHQSPEVLQLRSAFRSELVKSGWDPEEQGQENFNLLITSLNKVIQRALRSHEADETTERLSEIIRSGQSACAGKALTGAVVMERVFHEEDDFTDYSFQTVHGAYLPIREGKLPDINHTWMRISEGRHVALYDPYYNRSQTYDLENVVVGKDDPFQNYEVEAGMFSQFFIRKSVTAYGQNLQFPAHSRGHRELWLQEQDRITSQIRNSIETFLEMGEGECEFINGSFARYQPEGKARILNPVTVFEKAS